MERAARVLGKLRLAGDEKLVQAAWPLAVGKRIAARTGAVALFESRLVVTVQDPVWRNQLWTLRDQILQRMEQVLGRRIVGEIELRVALPKPGPKREETFTLSADEADGIVNPILRNIYRASRRRAAR